MAVIARNEIERFEPALKRNRSRTNLRIRWMGSGVLLSGSRSHRPVAGSKLDAKRKTAHRAVATAAA